MDLLRQKKLLELQKKMMLSQAKTRSPEPATAKASPRETVLKILEGRGPEVLETARRYYPKEVAQVEETLANLIESGKLKGPITAEELYTFLRRVGLVFSMDTKIRIKEHGELRTLEEKFRSRD